MIRAADLIERKRNGEEHSPEEIAALVSGYESGEIPDYQVAAWCMAVFFRGLTVRETYALTDAFIRSGEQLDFGAALGRRVVDKHSTGGVGDKTSIAVGPDRRRVRSPVREDERARARPHGRDAGQARVDSRLPGRAHDRTSSSRRCVTSGLAIVGTSGESRPGGQELLRPSGRHRDGRHRPAHRCVDHVEEDRRRSRRDRARREGGRRRVHEDARRRPHPRGADGRPRAASRARGRVPADGHGPASRTRRRQRARDPRGGRDDPGRRPGRFHGARARRLCPPPRALRPRGRPRRGHAARQGGDGRRLGSRGLRALDPRPGWRPGPVPSSDCSGRPRGRGADRPAS